MVYVRLISEKNLFAWIYTLFMVLWNTPNTPKIGNFDDKLRIAYVCMGNSFITIFNIGCGPAFNSFPDNLLTKILDKRLYIYFYQNVVFSAQTYIHTLIVNHSVRLDTERNIINLRSKSDIINYH